MLVERPIYTDRVLPFLGTPIVKVITGIRRSGKSTLIQLLVNKLFYDGVRRQILLPKDNPSGSTSRCAIR